MGIEVIPAEIMYCRMVTYYLPAFVEAWKQRRERNYQKSGREKTLSKKYSKSKESLSRGNK